MSLHDGCKMEVYSQGEGHGTTMSLYIPLHSPGRPSKLSKNVDLESGEGVNGALCCLPARGRIGAIAATAQPAHSIAMLPGAQSSDMVEEIPGVDPLPRESLIRNVAMKDLSIMVVDDSAVNRRMLIRLLQRSSIGGRIEEAVNGADFLEKMGVRIDMDDMSSKPPAQKGKTRKSANSFDSEFSNVMSFSSPCDKDCNGRDAGKIAHYDVCIMDNNMPIMDGDEAVIRIRRLGYMGLIVGLTGNGTDDDLERFRCAGADFVLVKPMHVQSLVDIINRYTLG